MGYSPRTGLEHKQNSYAIYNNCKQKRCLSSKYKFTVFHNFLLFFMKYQNYSRGDYSPIFSGWQVHISVFFIIICIIMLHRIVKMLIKYQSCLFANLKLWLHHIKCMHVAVVNIQLCLNSGLFQIVYLGTCFCIKRLSISHKAICWRKIGIMRLSCRSSIWRYLFSDILS